MSNEKLEVYLCTPTVINQDILQNYIYIHIYVYNYTGARILDQPKHKSEEVFTKILVSKEKLVRKFTALR